MIVAEVWRVSRSQKTAGESSLLILYDSLESKLRFVTDLRSHQHMLSANMHAVVACLSQRTSSSEARGTPDSRLDKPVGSAKVGRAAVIQSCSEGAFACLTDVRATTGVLPKSILPVPVQSKSKSACPASSVFPSVIAIKQSLLTHPWHPCTL